MELNEQRSVHFCFYHLAKHLILQMTSPTEVAHCFIKTQKHSNRNQHLFS
ncbi:hypothetical protein RLOC_00009901 [Lonchura striata]|uniref:Uncharacterized protein n=1 Tax=Lonchura striata TaxID=40157 RepID=A0A218V9D5_9PASE|nr:hypothetical protein RLOC_00009901 [Lonchura striata domestica]